MRKSIILCIVAAMLAAMPVQANVYYVSAAGSARADGKSADKPKKDL